MNIKKNIFLLLLMMGVSFSALSDGFFQVTKKINGDINCPLDMDVVYSSSFLTGLECPYHWWKAYNCTDQYDLSSIYCRQTYNGDNTRMYSIKRLASCPPGQEVNEEGFCDYPPPECKLPDLLNPITGDCETCEPPLELDPDTFECVDVPLCDRQSTTDAIFEAEQSCAAENGIFTFECSDFLDILETRCTQPNDCALGLPNWPQCLDGLDPTEPVSPPSGRFNPDNPDPINPTPPSFEKPEPDPVEPTDSTDTAVLTAIQNLNRDSNEAANALNKDMNDGFADTNNQLATLNSNALAIGGSLVDQMNQDYAIYEANKDLALQQTGAINNNGNNIVNAISGQTSSLKGSIEGQTTTLEGAIDRLADKIPEPCIPTAENNQCENPHGTTSGYVTDVFSQLSESVDGSISSGHSTILVEAQNAVTTPMTDDVQLVIEEQINMVLNVLPEYDDCTPLAIPSPFGGSFVIPCDFSVKFKTIFSFVIYFLTLNTLVDILFTGITPRAYTVNKG
ncbi:hypothetical protein ACFFUS_14055 [Vibrio gallaecicus]|nr:hypothetical protein [Vibrio gallaecicus]